MKVNLWKSKYTDKIYEMPTDWMPQYDGWELVGTIEKKFKRKLKKYLTIQS